MGNIQNPGVRIQMKGEVRIQEIGDRRQEIEFRI
jgi:hypothetical protein